METQKENGLFMNFLRLVTSSLAILLPVMQFIQQWIPKYKINIFVDKDSIFFTSLITLLLSVFVVLAYYSYPYFSFPLNPKAKKRYIEFINKINPRFNKPEEIKRVPIVHPPFEINAKILSLASIPLVLICGFWFVKIGIDYRNQTNISNDTILLQSTLYSVMIVASVFILTHFYISLSSRKNWLQNKKQRIINSINLAKENNGFKEFPKIVFEFAKDDYSEGVPRLIVEVTVDNTRYRIITDSDAEILYAVNKIGENNEN